MKGEEAPDVVLDDDGSGKVADVVTVRLPERAIYRRDRRQNVFDRLLHRLDSRISKGRPDKLERGRRKSLRGCAAQAAAQSARDACPHRSAWPVPHGRLE